MITFQYHCHVVQQDIHVQIVGNVKGWVVSGLLNTRLIPSTRFYFLYYEMRSIAAKAVPVFLS
jgi:hypothetical protein